MKEKQWKKEILKEIKNDLNIIEKIKIHLNKKLTFKIYKKGVKKGFNWGGKDK